MTPRRQRNLILEKVSLPMLEIKPLLTRTPLLSYRRTSLPTNRMMRAETVMAIKDVPVKVDVRVAVRMVKLGHPKLNVHQNPTSQQIRLRHLHRRETLNLHVYAILTGLQAEIAR